MENIVIFPVIHGKGDYIADTGSFSQVVALAHFVYDNEDELKKTIECIHDAIQFIDEASGQNNIITMLKLRELVLKNKLAGGKS